LEYNGSGAQTILSAIPYRNLSIAGSNTKTLDGNTSVAGDLTLGNKLVLGSSNLTLSGNASGGSSSNYVVVGGSGTMKKNIGTSTSFSFPVGNSAYNPVDITNNTTTSDEFSVRILDEVLYRGTAGKVATEPRVKRTWLIDKVNPTANSGSGVDFTFNWNSGELVSITTPALYHFDGTTWQRQNTGVTSSSTTSLTYTGYKGSFSPFAIGDELTTLPVAWLYLRCSRKQQNQALIEWATGSEQNSKEFEIQRGNSQGAFAVVGRIAAAGYSYTPKQYSFSDMNTAADATFYRIRQVDIDGSSGFSEICGIKALNRADNHTISIYPNPAETVIYLLSPERDKNLSFTLYNAAGQAIFTGILKEGKAEIPLNTISKGVYNLQLTGAGIRINERVVVR
jgi:hypothetical protein